MSAITSFEPFRTMIVARNGFRDGATDLMGADWRSYARDCAPCERFYWRCYALARAPRSR